MIDYEAEAMPICKLYHGEHNGECGLSKSIAAFARRCVESETRELRGRLDEIAGSYPSAEAAVVDLIAQVEELKAGLAEAAKALENIKWCAGVGVSRHSVAEGYVRIEGKCDEILATLRPLLKTEESK